MQHFKIRTVPRENPLVPQGVRRPASPLPPPTPPAGRRESRWRKGNQRTFK